MEKENKVVPTKETETIEDKIEETGNSSIHKIERYLDSHYDFRFNTVTGRVEFRLKGQHQFEVLTDFDANSLLRELQKTGINTSITALRGILNSDFSPKYDPFLSYFESLPPWDGKTDYIKMLASTVKTEDDEQWTKCFRKWLVAMCGCVLDERITNHAFIILIGKQGLGKSTWQMRLIPEELAAYRYSGTIRPENKDTLIHVSECMLIVWDELENFSRTEIGGLKELITKETIRLRRPYGYHTETLPRRASFAGSVNSREFLVDTTGSRRFLCFETDSIDYKHNIDLRNVYAQALHLFRSGKFQYWFSQEEINEITANNEQYRIMSIEEETLLSWYERAELKDATLFLTTTAIASELSAKAGISVTNASKLNLGKALKKHNFDRLKRKDRYVWALKEKDCEIVGYQTKYRLKEDEPG